MEKENLRNKREEGITLLALVITIIVLIILAGVSINAVMNDGLIGNAKEAKNEYDVAKEKEKIAITDLEVQTDFLKSGTPYLFRNGYLTGVTRPETVKSLADKLPKGYYVYASGDTPTPIDNPDTTPVATEMLLMKGETEESAQKVGTIIIFGDVDGDGSINMTDASQASNIWSLENYIINNDIKEYQIIAADVNHDGYVDILDDDLITDYFRKEADIDQNVYASEVIVKNLKWNIENYINNLPVDFTNTYKVEYNEEKDRYQIMIQPDTVTIGMMKEKLNDINATIRQYDTETKTYLEDDDTILANGSGIWIKFEGLVYQRIIHIRTN